jgi:hypothetical protein
VKPRSEIKPLEEIKSNAGAVSLERAGNFAAEVGRFSKIW